MYIPPIMPDENRVCYQCIFYHYDSFYDESWCSEKNGKKYRPMLISGDGTCEFFESWELKEKQKLKQKMLF